MSTRSQRKKETDRKGDHINESSEEKRIAFPELEVREKQMMMLSSFVLETRSVTGMDIRWLLNWFKI